MIRNSFATVVALIVFVFPLSASAQLFTAERESPRSHMFEIKFGMYTPNIDSESGLDGKPYQTIFGDDGMFLTKFEYDYQLWKGFGSVALGVEFGFGEVSGHGLELDTNEESSDTTVFTMIPMSLV